MKARIRFITVGILLAVFTAFSGSFTQWALGYSYTKDNPAGREKVAATDEVFLLTRSYYRQLLEAGVRIYEYTPGFIHAKSFVCDDEIAVVGTINLDYRSLYLHFECAAWMYQCQAVGQVKEDMLNTFRNSREVSLNTCKEQNVFRRGLQSILRLFAPML